VPQKAWRGMEMRWVSPQSEATWQPMRASERTRWWTLCVSVLWRYPPWRSLLPVDWVTLSSW